MNEITPELIAEIADPALQRNSRSEPRSRKRRRRHTRPHSTAVAPAVFRISAALLHPPLDQRSYRAEPAAPSPAWRRRLCRRYAAFVQKVRGTQFPLPMHGR